MTTGHDPLSQYTWWASLNHGGLLIAPARLANYFEPHPRKLSSYWTDRLRTVVQAQQDSEPGAVRAELLDTVLENVCGLPAGQWAKASAVDASWSHRLITGEQVRPRRIWQGPHSAVLPLFTEEVKQVGVGTGRRAVARVVEWLRKSEQKIALLTNGAQWRLIHAGPDYEAWCEWEIGLWFEAGQPSQQVDALIHLLSPAALSPAEPGKPSPLIAAIQDTRKGQAELSASLGERVRLAIEHLIHSSGEVIDQLRNESAAVTPRDVYIAATRLIMRCVVVLFAEARELLPRTDPVYNDSYSMQGLREQLDRMAGGRSKESLRQQVSAWPRLISLFRLIYEGSPHPGLPVRAYGGGLFQPGYAGSTDAILRALSLFEHPKNAPSDHSVHHILELLTRAWEKVPQGRSTRMVLSPIDFSDLSTEYIGILYEGLLDFQLRRADSPIVFLNIGDQPALPFLELDRMKPDEIAKLFEKFKERDRKADGDESGDDDSEAGDAEAEEAEETPAPEAADGPVEETAAVTEAPEEGDPSADREQQRQQIHAWARKAAEVAKLVKPPSGKSVKPETQRKYEEDLDKAARWLVPRTIFPGEWFLVREGNTRKGSGTFYTRPQLAGPITRRALRGLAYEGDTPKRPEEILALKVCDPACGSGSFLLSALRFLTEALVESLHHHRRLEPGPAGVIVRLADGQALTKLSDETIPKPVADPDFNGYLRAYLRRHIVERCLYGVDLDELAVELGRLALWIETMDPRLPFGFLDHKVKCGNALIGCWFDRFQDYPALAWDREGGDKDRKKFVHHFRGEGASAKGDKWTHAIKEHKERVRVELVQIIRTRREQALPFFEERLSPAGTHDHLVDVFERLHSLPIHDYEERRREYEASFGPGSAYRHLRTAFDTWCAIWFWPPELIEHAPMPADFLRPPPRTRTLVHDLRALYRFFHWELEFPDVFTATRRGFDAVIGNPPWEVQKPNSKEFFSNIDPLYRSYGKQEALDRQMEYFRHDANIEANWLHYCGRLKAQSNWVKYAAEPFGDRVREEPDGKLRHAFKLDSKFSSSAADHAVWEKMRAGRTGYADPNHPFLHQGSADLNTYKMFLETGYALLRDGGRLALLVPSGVYSDKGAGALRRLFLGKARWSHLYAFQNERFVFAAVHHSFKVAAIQVEKAGCPGSLLTRFRLGPGDSPEPHELETDIPDERGYLPVSVSEIDEFSPHSGAILEVRTPRDLEIVKKLYANGVLLGDKSPDGWNIRYATEFHMTNDSKLFPPRWKWEEQGYRPDEYGHWLKGNWQPYSGERNILRRPKGLILSADGAAGILIGDVEDVALPLYQGAMIHQFDFCAAAYRRVEGKRGFKWVSIDWPDKRFEPQYLLGRSDYVVEGGRSVRGGKLAIRDIARSTDARTLISTMTADFPCGHTLPVLSSSAPELLASLTNSYWLDYALRERMAGTHLVWFVLEDLPLIHLKKLRALPAMIQCAAGLSLGHVAFARNWLGIGLRRRGWRESWAASPAERLRTRAIIEALSAHQFSLRCEEVDHILRGCDRPSDFLQSSSAARTLDPKGFWRSERDTAPELRLAVLTQIAYRQLLDMGPAAFTSQNGGEGWMLPDTIRLADYGLGHDDRARGHQPVAGALGPRFYPWQLGQSVDQSWEECDTHASVLAKLLPSADDRPQPDQATPDHPKDLFGNPLDVDLFGNPILSRKGRR